LASAVHTDTVLMTIGGTRADRTVFALVPRRAEAYAFLAQTHVRAVGGADVLHQSDLARIAFVSGLALANAVDTCTLPRAVADALSGCRRAVDAAIAHIARADAIGTHAVTGALIWAEPAVDADGAIWL